MRFELIKQDILQMFGTFVKFLRDDNMMFAVACRELHDNSGIIFVW